MWPVTTVAVIGADAAGRAVALAAAHAGCAVRLVADGPALADAVAAIRARVEAAVAAGALAAGDRQRILDAILATDDLEEAAVGADLALVTGAAPDASLPRLAAALRTTALVAVTPGDAARLADVPQPGRALVLGVHDPGPLPRVRVTAGPATAPHALARAERFAARLDAVADHPSGR